MTSPSIELRGAIHAHLRADVGLADLIEGIYDRVPKGALFPYLTYGEVSLSPNDASCITANEHVFDIHVWDRQVGSVRAENVAHLVKARLHRNRLDLSQHAAHEIIYRNIRKVADEDGLTTHVVVSFGCYVQEL